MSTPSREEQIARDLVFECCPKHFPMEPSSALGGLYAASPSFDWAKLVAILKVILPVLLDLLSKNTNPTPGPSPDPPPPVPHPVP